jgi:hypothetical protein
MDNKLYVKVKRKHARLTENYDVSHLHVSNNSDLNIVDSNGQAHVIPTDDWETVEIRRVQKSDMMATPVGQPKPR